MEEILVKGYKLSVTKGISSGDIMYNMGIIVNNIVSLKVTERVDLKCPHTLPPNGQCMK